MNVLIGNAGISSLNEMQQQAISAIAKKKDVVLLAPTGSGKTLAFLLPVAERLDPDANTTQAMIIVPSRELALQIESVFRTLRTDNKITSCYGGHKREIEENNLVQPPAIIVGTPGRIADHIRRENITTATITTLVLDEFDKSLEAGFWEEILFITGALPAVTQRVLTSATEAVEIPSFIAMQEAEKLNFIPHESQIKLEVKKIRSPETDKSGTLLKLVCNYGNKPMIIFCNQREVVEQTSRDLSNSGITNVFYHGAMEQVDREAALAKFRNGTANVLVTTDLASRGLDIPGIRHIVHYQLPDTEEIFTHRNGRTARMEASGTAVIILGPAEYLPPYVGEVEDIYLSETIILPDKPRWSTLFIAAGKKDKVNKVDIVGFLSNKGQLKKEDIGLIEVKDFFSFVAIRRSRMSHTLHLIKDHKIKNKKVKMAVAK